MPDTTTGTYQDVVDAQVRAIFERHKEEQSNELYYKELGLNDYEPDVQEEQLNDISGPDRAILTTEAQEYGTISRYRGYPVTLKLRKYTYKLSWTEEDIHWMMKQSSSKRMSELRNAGEGAVQSLYQVINEDTAKVFYLGFGTTFLNVGNSESLVGSHTIRADGSTQRNDFGSGDTQRPLGSTAITDLIAKMNRFNSHNAVKLKRIRNLKLIVSGDKIADAMKIVWSDYGPDSGALGRQQASKNALAKRGMSITPVEVPDFPSAYADYWFLSDVDRARARAFMAWGWKPRMTRDDQASKGVLREVGSAYFGPIVLGWQWLAGSKGDDAAIA